MLLSALTLTPHNSGSDTGHPRKVYDVVVWADLLGLIDHCGAWRSIPPLECRHDQSVAGDLHKGHGVQSSVWVKTLWHCVLVCQCHCVIALRSCVIVATETPRKSLITPPRHELDQDIQSVPSVEK